MKTLVEILNEALLNEAKLNSFGFPADYEFPGSWDLINLVRGEVSVQDYLNEWNGDGDDYSNACKKLERFIKKTFEAGQKVFLGNYNPSEEGWELFYGEVDKNDHGLVTLCDGDGGEFTVLYYKKNVKKSRELQDFMDMLKSNGNRYMLEEF